MGGNITVEGTISDGVMVINGNLRLGSTASVREHAIILGGNLLTEEGAHIGKRVFRIGGDFAFADTLMAAGVVIAGGSRFFKAAGGKEPQGGTEISRKVLVGSRRFKIGNE
ncbi:hypothetical protein [Sporomusa carbonis]|uniref:hypothetical protein n=1 Tax=Sporomusa carbonis TaxID=3076075 RepID=UPI003C7E2F66